MTKKRSVTLFVRRFTATVSKDGKTFTTTVHGVNVWDAEENGRRQYGVDAVVVVRSEQR